MPGANIITKSSFTCCVNDAAMLCAFMLMIFLICLTKTYRTAKPTIAEGYARLVMMRKTLCILRDAVRLYER